MEKRALDATGDSGSNPASLMDLAPLFFATFLFFGMNNTLTSALPQHLLSLGGSALLAGLQNGLFILLAIALRLFFAPLSDRRGSRPLLIVGALGFFLPCAGIALCEDVPTLFALRLLQAVGLAAFHPNVAHYITVRAGTEDTARYVGVSRFMSTASLMVMPAVLFPLIDAGSYRLFYLTLALAGFIGTLLVVLLRPDTPSRSREKAPLMPTPTPRALRPDRSCIPLIAMPFVLALAYGIILTFGPLFMGEVLPTVNSGLLLTCASLGGLAGSLLASRLVKRWRAPRALLVLQLAFAAGLVTLAASTLGALAVFGGALLCGLGYFGTTTALVAELGLRAPAANAGTLFSAQQTCLDLGMVAGSLAAGAVLQTGVSLAVAFGVSALVLAACSGVWVVCDNAQRGT